MPVATATVMTAEAGPVNAMGDGRNAVTPGGGLGPVSVKFAKDTDPSNPCAGLRLSVKVLEEPGMVCWFAGLMAKQKSPVAP